jgi:hypothetical protein
MAMSPRELLQQSRLGFAASAAGAVKVFVALKSPTLDSATKYRLDQLQFVLEQTIANKLVGTIPATNLPALRADPSVSETEVSQRLSPNLPRPH